MSTPITPSFRIEKLEARHAVSAFDCGVPALNRFLSNFALTNQRAGSAQTYVAVSGDAVVGYHSLTVGEIAHSGAPERLAKGLLRHPVPVMVLARLAVDRNFKRQKLGGGLLLDALRRTLAAADIAGIRAVVVHAKDAEARAFYEHFGFVPFDDQPLSLFRLIKDIRLMQAP